MGDELRPVTVLEMPAVAGDRPGTCPGRAGLARPARAARRVRRRADVVRQDPGADPDRRPGHRTRPGRDRQADDRQPARPVRPRPPAGQSRRRRHRPDPAPTDLAVRRRRLPGRRLPAPPRCQARSCCRPCAPPPGTWNTRTTTAPPAAAFPRERRRPPGRRVIPPTRPAATSKMARDQRQHRPDAHLHRRAELDAARPRRHRPGPGPTAAAPPWTTSSTCANATTCSSTTAAT